MTTARAEPACLACGARPLEPWAEARDVEYFSTADAFRYLRCRACGALSIDPVPAARLAEIYPPTYYSFAAGRPSVVERIKQALDRRMFRALLRQLPGAELSALDVGGGSGWLMTQARAAEPRLTRTTILDLDPAAREAAVGAGHAFHLGRAEEFATDERFDAIFMLNIVEHVAAPEAVLRAMGRLLKPGGRILLKTPNHDSLDARLFRHRFWGGYHCPRHWVLFTPESLAATAARAGLRVRRLDCTQGAPFWACSVLHWLQQRGVVSLSYARPAHRHPLMPLLLAGFALLDFVRRPFMRTSQMLVELERA